VTRSALLDRNRQRAKDMRRLATPAERVLWHGVRRRGLGVRFRRQFPLGPYILDFYCHAAGLVVEVDGATHGAPGVDSQRDDWLAKRGLTILRFWNNEVLENLEGVLHVIAAALPPSRNGRGRGRAFSLQQNPAR
jgi:very-short-patch-repair endonuclease